MLVHKEGMFWKLRCSCPLRDKEKYRIIAKTDIVEVDLGLCYHVGNELVLDTRISKRQLGQGSVTFVLVREGQKFYPFTQPFYALSKLRQGVFDTQNGNPGLLIREVSAKQDSDQNP